MLQMLQIGFLRRIVLLSKGQEPVLNHAWSQFVERFYEVRRNLHPARNHLYDFFIINGPSQSLRNLTSDDVSARTSFAVQPDSIKLGLRGI
jgi:hypothetical protein